MLILTDFSTIKKFSFDCFYHSRKQNVECSKSAFWMNKRIFSERYSFHVLRDDIHTTPMKIFQFSRLPTPLAHLRPTFFQPLHLGRSISNKLLSPNDNQSIKRKHNPRMNIWYQVLPSDRLSFSVSTH